MLSLSSLKASITLRLWSDPSEEALKLSEADFHELGSLTIGFSFAYLKELWLSSMMGSVEFQMEGAMLDTSKEQLPILREQILEPPPDVPQVADQDILDDKG